MLILGGSRGESIFFPCPASRSCPHAFTLGVPSSIFKVSNSEVSWVLLRFHHSNLLCFLLLLSQLLAITMVSPREFRYLAVWVLLCHVRCHMHRPKGHFGERTLFCLSNQENQIPRFSGSLFLGSTGTRYEPGYSFSVYLKTTTQGPGWMNLRLCMGHASETVSWFSK